MSRSFAAVVLLVSSQVYGGVKLCNKSPDRLDIRVKNMDGVLCLDWRPLAASRGGKQPTCQVFEFTQKECIGGKSPEEVKIEVDSHNSGKCFFDSVKNSIRNGATIEPNEKGIRCVVE